MPCVTEHVHPQSLLQSVHATPIGTQHIDASSIQTKPDDVPVEDVMFVLGHTAV